MIDQIATSRNINSMQLIQHSQNINQILREKSQDSRTLSALSREMENIGRQLMQTVDLQKRQGARVIVCESPAGLHLEIDKVAKMLKESSNALQDMANKFDKHARGYDYQVQANDRIMNTLQSIFSLKTRVATCEQQSNARLMKQKNSLSRAMPKIQDHEMTLEGLQGIFGLTSSSVPLLNASRRLFDSL